MSAANQKVDKLEHRRHLDALKNVHDRIDGTLATLDTILDALPAGSVDGANLAAFRDRRVNFQTARDDAYTAQGQPLMDQGHERVVLPPEPNQPPAAPGAQTLIDATRGFFMNRVTGEVFRKQGPTNIQEEKQILVKNENDTIDILNTLKEMVSFGSERGYAHAHYRTYMKRLITKIDKDLYDSVTDQTTAQELADMLCQYHWSTVAQVNVIGKVKAFVRKKNETLSSAVQRYKFVLHAMLVRTEPNEDKRAWKEEQLIQDTLKTLVHPKLKQQVEHKIQQKRDFRITLNITDYVEVLSEWELENDLLPTADVPIKEVSDTMYNTEYGSQAKRTMGGTTPRMVSPIRESASSPYANLITGAKRKTYDSSTLPRQQSTSPRRIITARRRTTPSPGRAPPMPQQAHQYQNQGAGRQTPSPQRYQQARPSGTSPWRGHQIYKAQSPQRSGYQNERQSRRENFDRRDREPSGERNRYNRSGSRYRSQSRNRYTKNNMYTGDRNRSFSRKRLQSPGSYFLKIVPGVTVPYNYSHRQAPNTCLKCGQAHKTGNCIRYVSFSSTVCGMCHRGMHRETECKQQRQYHVEVEEKEECNHRKVQEKGKNCKLCL